MILIQVCEIDHDDITNHFSDHQAIITRLNLKQPASSLANSNTGVRKRNWNKVDFDKLKASIPGKLPKIEPLTSREQIETFDQQVRGLVASAMDDASPLKAPSGKHKAWWRPAIMEPLRHAASSSRKKLKKENSQINREAYNKARNAFGRAVKEQKTIRWRKFLSELTHKNLFSAKKFAMGKSPSQLIQTLIDKQGNTCESNERKADLLLQTTCVATVPCDLSDTLNLTFPIYDGNKLPKEQLPPFLQHITKETVEETLFASSPMKAPGHDRIQNWVWQKVWNLVKNHVIFLFKMITITGIIPNSWKSAKTVMLPKTGKSDYTSPSSYRPMALQNTLSKIYEKLLTKILSQQVETGKLLHRGHYGGRPNRSSQEATVHLVSWIKNQWAKGKVVGALFADVKSAFLSVHHPRLMDTLAKKGVNKEILNIIHEFLTNRETNLAFNGYESEPFSLTHAPRLNGGVTST